MTPTDTHDMHVDDVADRLRQLAQPIAQTEQVALHDALGRVLAQDVVSPLNVPPHDNSAMDGYAFHGAQLRAGEPLLLRPVGATALAGMAGAAAVAPGECVKIMTGAVMPQGLDTVVPQELTSVEADGRIRIPAGTLQPGSNRRLAGEDLRQGHVALAQGELLTPAALGLAASLGLQAVTAYRRLRVACLSTGNEILRPGEPPREGAVYDSNRYALIGLLTRLGVQVIDLGVVRDDPALLAAALRRTAGEADAILTSGGAGAGEADHTRATLGALGDVAFWRIAMRPGRPMAAGKIQAKSASSACPTSAGSYQNSSILFGLPGNPVAAMVSFLAFVRPALLRMMGCTRPAPPLLRAVAAEPLRKRPGRTEYQRGVVSSAVDGTLLVRTTGNQGSGVLSSMVQANGLIVLPHAQGPVAPGETVDVMMFDGVI